MSLNIASLPADIATEVAAIKVVVVGIQQLVTETKANGLTSVAIADVEALLPEVESAIVGGETVVKDL